MKTLTFSFVLSIALTARADPGDVDVGSLFTTSLDRQQPWQARPLLQMAQGTTEEDVCLGKCQEERLRCLQSDKAESECGDALSACQQACEEKS